GGEFAGTARQVLAHRADPKGAAIPAALERYYRLRWDAARVHGVIDGQIWSQTLLEELCESDAFLEALTLRLVTELGVEGAKDHVLQILLDGEGLGRIGAAIKLMPAAVELMIEAGVWRPRDRKEWSWLVTTVLHEELQPYFPRALASALPFEFPIVSLIAAGLLYEADPRFEEILVEAFEGEDAALRAQAAYVAGASEILAFAPRLRELLDDPNPWIAANAMGALIRMGSPQAATRAVELLATAPEDREPRAASFLFEVLARCAPDPEVITFLETIHRSLEGPDRAAADSILLISRRSVSTEALRRELPLLNPLTVQAFRGAQALGVSPNEQDLRLLARLFPREQAP
ncbi:MAG: HEAT repeat domain-containing protein, partial [Planctomycetota bacterium]|nr:HEAT repeat domain-containing protein [Planctomycetota bacterium]